jgi:hypothetical protein
LFGAEASGLISLGFPWLVRDTIKPVLAVLPLVHLTPFFPFFAFLAAVGHDVSSLQVFKG